MPLLFGRRYKLNINGVLIEDLRLKFVIQKTLKPEPNQVTLEVWNLSPDTRKQIQTKYIPVQLEAGYESGTQIILFGDLRRVDHFRAGPDWVSRIRGGDGEKAARGARVQHSFRPGAKIADVGKVLVDSMKIPAGNVLQKLRKGDVSGALQEFSTGATLTGPAYEKLVGLFANMGYDLSIQDGQMQALAKDEIVELPFVLLSPETGLLGSPEAGEKGIIKVRSLLNGELFPGRGVTLQSRDYAGLNYRVEKVTHAGDTHAGDWISELELSKLSNR